MLLDDYSLKIIGESLGFDEEAVMEFVFGHFKHIYDLTTAETLGYLAENDEEKMMELENLINEAKTPETKIQISKIIQEQIKLTLESYPDLQELIEERVNTFDHEVFFRFLETGPTDGALELLEYLQSKLKSIDKYQKVQEIIQQRFTKEEVKKFLKED